jgi:hypothetical protein
VSEQIGPYDADICRFCHKSARDGVDSIAGFQRRQEGDTSGPFYDCCQKCLLKEKTQCSDAS